ncbi:hypothetical protein LTR85_011793 [Meristemomyces frigidus]|nr:hypothetical protein LTR85_011793 [Meristemomyces frigidus]
MAPPTARAVAENTYQKLRPADAADKSVGQRTRDAKTVITHVAERKQQGGDRALTEGVKRLRLADGAGSAIVAESASMPSSATAEMATATSASVLPFAAAQDDDELDSDSDTAPSPTMSSSDDALASASLYNIFIGLAENFFDPARPKLELQLTTPLTDVGYLLRGSDVFPFVKICFIYPDGRKRFQREDQGVITAGCKIDSNDEQPTDIALATLTNYVLGIEYNYSSAFYVEDAGVLAAFKQLTKKQMVLHVIKDGQKVAVQTDPRIVCVHYQARQSAAEGYCQHETEGHDSYHRYEKISELDG